ncbi:MAG: hypothetical protein H0X28_06850 [Solirubrobacterales bacterium]|nr:hypothetical protein [Solirubrobacterales bacterium]
MSALAFVSGSFVREHLRTPVTMVMLAAIPVFFVLIFASVLGQFAGALGGTLAGGAASAISAGWAAAFLCGSLAFFQVSSSRGADRRLASAGMGAGRVALARITAAVALGVAVSATAYLTLWARSGIAHPAHAAAAILAFAFIYIGIGALIGAFVSGALEGSLLVVLVFSVDVFSGPAMTSTGGLLAYGPTRDAAKLLIAAGTGQGSPGGEWAAVTATVAAALAAAFGAFWLAARSRT